MSRATIRVRWVLPLAALALAACSSPALAEQRDETERVAELRKIVAAGLGGSLLIAGSEPSDDALRVFLEHAHGEQARIVLIRTGAQGNARQLTRRLLEQWESQPSASFQVFTASSRESVDRAELLEAIRAATGVWLMGSDAFALCGLLAGRPCGEQLAALVQRGGIVAAAGPVAAALASRLPASDEARSPSGLGLLPDSLIEINSSAEDRQPQWNELLVHAPGAIGYEIDPTAALLVHHRGLRRFGPGSVQIHLAATATLPAVTKSLDGPGDSADLTALRRTVLDRLAPRFPPAQPRPPIVEKGTLVIVGGGGMPEGLGKRFVELAGGKEAVIVTIPISSPDPLPARDRVAEAFRTAGAEVITLKGRTPQAADSEESLAALRRATGIWFGGGRQWRFIDAYEGTRAAELMHDVLRRGGVIGGSSAGASIQGEYMARGNPLGSNQIMADGYERGLDFLHGVAIDQHFTQRNRFKDLASLVDRYPQLLGIGLDEGTAIVVQGREAEVVGRGAAHFYDRRKPVEPGQSDHDSYTAGRRYDLVDRKPSVTE